MSERVILRYALVKWQCLVGTMHILTVSLSSSASSNADLDLVSNAFWPLEAKFAAS